MRLCGSHVTLKYQIENVVDRRTETKFVITRCYYNLGDFDNLMDEI